MPPAQKEMKANTLKAQKVQIKFVTIERIQSTILTLQDILSAKCTKQILDFRLVTERNSEKFMCTVDVHKMVGGANQAI